MRKQEISADWGIIRNCMVRECKDSWSQPAAPALPASLERVADLLAHVLQFPCGERNFDGLAEPVIAAMRICLLEESGTRGDRVVHFRKLSEFIEPYLNKVLYLSDRAGFQEMMDKAAAKDKPPALCAVLLKLNLATGKVINDAPQRLIGEPRFAEVVRRTYDLRNEVHRGREWTNREISAGVVDILNVYLFATSEHYAELHACLSNLRRRDYLDGLRKRMGKGLDRIVLLDASEREHEDDFLDFEPTANEVPFEDVPFEDAPFEDDALFAEHESYDESSSHDKAEETVEPLSHNLRRGPIRQLVDSVPRMALLGEPGAGKTTTLVYLTSDLASQLIRTPTSQLPCPVYVALRRFSSGSSLVEVLKREYGTSLEDDLHDGNLVLLLDGLNEVRDSCRQHAVLEIEDLLLRFPRARVILASRIESYRNQLRLPVFTLQALTDIQIEAFLERNFPSGEDGREFARLLRRHPRLWEQGRNPLKLMMLARIAQSCGGELPRNSGHLMGQFIDWIFERESKKRPQTDNYTKKRCCARLAFETRGEGSVCFSRDAFIRIVGKELTVLNSRLDIIALLNELLDNSILTEDGPNLVFQHEMFQEYFCAEFMLQNWGDNIEGVEPFVGKEEWVEPIMLLYGLLPPAASLALLRIMAGKDIASAARCIASKQQIEAEEMSVVTQAMDLVCVDTTSPKVLSSVLKAACILDMQETVFGIVGSNIRRGSTIAECFALAPNRTALVVGCLTRMGDDRTSWGLELVELLHTIDDEDRRMHRSQVRDLVIHWMGRPRFGMRGRVASRLVSLFGLSELAPDLARCLLGSGKLVAALECIDRHGLSSLFPLGEIIQQLISSGELDEACAWVKRFGLEDKFPPEGILQLLVDHKETEMACKWLWAFHVRGDVTPSHLVRVLIGEGKLESALNWISEFSLRSEFHVANLIEGLIEAGEFGAACKWVTRYGLEDVFPPSELVRKLLDRMDLGTAHDIIEANGLRDDFCHSDIVRKFAAEEHFGAACRWALWFGVVDGVPGMEMVRRLLEKGSADQACTWVKKLQLERRFPPLDQIRSFIIQGDSNNACRWSDQFSITDKDLQSDLIQLAIANGRFDGACKLVAWFNLRDRFEPAELIRGILSAGDANAAFGWVVGFGIKDKAVRQGFVTQLIGQGRTSEACRWIVKLGLADEFRPSLKALVDQLIARAEFGSASKYMKAFELKDQFQGLCTYTEEDLQDPSKRFHIERELQDKTWEMEVLRALTTFGFLANPAFSENVYCDFRQIKDGPPNVGDKVKVSVSVNYVGRKGKWTYCGDSEGITGGEPDKPDAPRADEIARLLRHLRERPGPGPG